MLSCPSGLATGFGVAMCCAVPKGGQQRQRPPLKRRDLARIFLAILAIGFVAFYLPLTFICAKADGSAWKLYSGGGECWSEGGDAPGVNLGLIAGAAMGFGLAGLLVVLSCGADDDACDDELTEDATPRSQLVQVRSQLV